MLSANVRVIFLEKKSWAQIIEKCIIQPEMAKKIRRQMAVFGGSGGFRRFFEVP